MLQRQPMTKPITSYNVKDLEDLLEVEQRNMTSIIK